MNENKALLYQYSQAAEVIKTAILQSQHQTIVGINRAQLALYFGIGKYLSYKTRNASWGTNALQSISTTLRKDLPVTLYGYIGYQHSDTQIGHKRINRK